MAPFFKVVATLAAALILSGCVSILPHKTAQRRLPTVHAALQAPSFAQENTSSENVQANGVDFSTYFQAVENEDYARALIVGGKAIDQLADQLSTTSSPALASVRLFTALAIELEQLNRFQDQHSEAHKLHDQILDQFSETWAPSSSYILLHDFTAQTLLWGELERAEKDFASLSALVRDNFDFPSEERAQFFLLEAELIFRRLHSDKGSLRKVKKTIYPQIRNTWEKAFDDYVAIGNQVGAGHSRFQRGRFEMANIESGDAEIFLREALTLYEQGGLLPEDDLVLECHTFLAQLYERLNKPQKSIPHRQHVKVHQGIKERNDPVPLFLEHPKYPFFAKRSRTAGRVLVEFTITEEGGVIDPVVLESSPAGVFDKSAKKAIVKWKYAPVLENGVPIEMKWKVY